MRCPLSPSISLLAVLLFCLTAGRAADGGATLRDAVAALERGDFPSAEQKLRAELVAHPSDASALSLLGVALDNQKKFREAVEAHRRAIANAPRSAGILHNYGNHLGMTGDDEGARKVYLRVVALDPANHDANLQLARLALKRKSGPEALGYLKRLPANRQDTSNVVVLRVEALYLAGNHADADALVARLSPAAQGDLGLSSSLGLALANAGQFDKAETFLALALAAAPADFDVLYSLGVTASRAGHYPRARGVLETALRQQPQNVDVLYSLAYVIDALKQPEEAIRLLAQAARLAPQRADIQKALAIITTGLGANEDALAAWNRYLKLEPNDEFARRERGYSAVRLGQFEQGIADLQWFLARHPDDAVGYFQLGRAESETDPAKALIHLDKSLALKPDFAPARSARGGLYYRMGKPETAVTDFESAAALLPDDAIILDRLGQTYLALDRPADAVRVLRRAAELAPEDSKTLFHFGRALADVGQSAESKAVMDRFRQLGSNTKRLVPGGLVDYLSLTPDERRADYRARVESAVLKDPSDAAAQARYLKLLLEDGKSDQAAAAARQIAGLRPGAAVLAEVGRTLLESKQYSLAKELLEQAAAAGSSSDVRLDLAIAIFHATGAKEGLQQMDRVPESERSSDYHLARAHMLDASGRSEEAISELDRALRAAPKRSDLYREAAASLTRNGRAPQALRLLDQAARTLPQDREILLMKAATLELAGQSEAAERLLDEIQNRWPEWYAGWVARGVILAAHKRYEDARQALQTAVVFGARSPETYFYLADCTHRATPERSDAAEVAIRQALKLAPDDPWIKALAGRIAFGRGDYSTAVERQREAIRLRPGSVQAHSSLARAYSALGRKQEAQAELELAAAIQRDSSATADEPPYLSRLFLEKAPQSW